MSITLPNPIIPKRTSWFILLLVIGSCASFIGVGVNVGDGIGVVVGIDVIVCEGIEVVVGIGLTVGLTVVVVESQLSAGCTE